MTSSVTMTGKEFAALVQGATKFPSIGLFGGSEMVNFKVGKGFAVCTTLGVVLARAAVPIQGDLPLIAVDERLIVPFASQHAEAVKIVIEADEKEIRIKARGRKIEAPFKEGTEQPFPKLDTQGIKITPMLAERVGYLANVAFSDLSRPDLCCVMVAPDGRAMACNSRAIVVLKCHSGHDRKIAMPLPLAKALEKGFTIFPGEKETAIKNGYAKYCMPSPVQALQQFPIAAIDSYSQLESSTVAVFKGMQLARAVTEAEACMGALSRMEMVLKLSLADGRAAMSTENGAARYQTKMGALKITAKELDLNLPMEEMLRISPFLEKEEAVTVLMAKRNGEAFLKFKNGWAMFPKWGENKK